MYMHLYINIKMLTFNGILLSEWPRRGVLLATHGFTGPLMQAREHLRKLGRATHPLANGFAFLFNLQWRELLKSTLREQTGNILLGTRDLHNLYNMLATRRELIVLDAENAVYENTVLDQTVDFVARRSEIGNGKQPANGGGSIQHIP